jgi:hypothetical protein
MVCFVLFEGLFEGLLGVCSGFVWGLFRQKYPFSIVQQPFEIRRARDAFDALDGVPLSYGSERNGKHCRGNHRYQDASRWP